MKLPKSFREIEVSSIVSKKKEVIKNNNGLIAEVNDSSYFNFYLVGKIAFNKDDPDCYELDMGEGKKLMLQYRNLQSLLVEDESIIKEIRFFHC